MVNLTISVNENTLQRARISVLEEDSSVNTLLGDAQTHEILIQRRQALTTLRSLADQYRCGCNGQTWSRDELHER
jgi:hypothetical protein